MRHRPRPQRKPPLRRWPPSLILAGSLKSNPQLLTTSRCQCTAHACPCQKNGAPTHGTCEAADFAHITTGRYGKVRLDSLDFGNIGNLVDRNASRLYATTYISQEANTAQREVLTAILQFLFGAYETSPLKASQIKTVPLTFSESPDKTIYGLVIPGILEERALLHRDASGKLL